MHYPVMLTSRCLVAPTGTGPVSTPYEGAALTIKLRGLISFVVNYIGNSRVAHSEYST